MKNWRYILFILLVAFNFIDAKSQDGKTVMIVESKTVEVLDGDSISAKQIGPSSIFDERVIVGKDTIGIIIPEKNFGRYDRGLFNFLFIPKGQWAFGLNASYGSFDVGDMQLLSYLKDFDFKGSMFSIRPDVSYFFRNNQSIGMRLGYSRTNFDLNKLKLDLGDDLNIDLSDVLYHTESYSASIFYRHYIGLGRDKRFAIFNEVDLSFASGSGQFKRNYDGQPRDTRTITTEARLNFSPGLCVFIHDNISFNVSFGVFGLYLKNEKQKTNNVEEGSRFTSGANFKFNLFNISLGLGVHI